MNKDATQLLPESAPINPAVVAPNAEDEKKRLIEKYSSNEFTQALLKHMYEAKKIALCQFEAPETNNDLTPLG